MSKTKFLIQEELLNGQSQSNIARKLNISRQMVHIVKKELIKNGVIKEKDIVKYPKRKPKEFHNSLLHENKELLNSYIKLYSDGATLNKIYKQAKKDGIVSVYRSVNEAFEQLGYKKIYPTDINTGKKLNFLFKDKKFVWRNNQLKLVKKKSSIYRNFKNELDTTTFTKQNYTIKFLYDEFSKFAKIPYTTWTIWMSNISSLFKIQQHEKGSKYVPLKDFMIFLDNKF